MAEPNVRAELALLASLRIADRVVRQLDIADQRAIARGASSSDIDHAAAMLLANVQVAPRHEAYAAVIRYRDADPSRAVKVANRMVAQYVAYRRETGARALRIGQARHRSEVALQDMTRTKAAAAAYRASVPATESDDLARLQREAAALDVRLAERKAREGRTADNATDPGADPSIKALQAQLAQTTARRAKLQERYGPLHPDIIEVNARVAALIERIDAETRRVESLAQAARTAHERWGQKIAEAAEREERQAALDTAATLAASRYAESLADVHRAETLTPAGGDARVLAPARISSTEAVLDRSMVGAIGFLAALTGAGSVVAVRELSGSGFGSAATAKRKLGLPVIGLVPEVSRAAGPATSRAVLHDLVLSDTAPDFVAAFRTINSRLGVGAGAERLRSIAVTSAFESEGKTTVAIGIARIAARAGLRVLLVDCDVRRPAATRALAPEAEASLADVLTGKVDLARAVVRDGPSGLWFLANGQAAPVGLAANGLVGSEAMLNLIERAGDDYDLVVLDTAPVLALAETRVAASFAQRVLLVARWRTTPVKATRLALNLLNEAGSNVAALVLTRVAA